MSESLSRFKSELLRLTELFSANFNSYQSSGYDEAKLRLLEKIKSSGTPLNKIIDGKIYRGVLTGLNEAFVIDEATRSKLLKEDPKSAELIKPYLAGRDVGRYEIKSRNQWLIFTRRGINIDLYPAIKNHLQIFKKQLMPKPSGWKPKSSDDLWTGRKSGSYEWYEIQDSIDYYTEFEKPKIVVASIARESSYAFDDDGFYSNDKTTIIASKDLFLLGLLNSKVLELFMHKIASTKQCGYSEYKPMYIEQMPIAEADKETKKQIAEKVELMLAAKKQLAHTSSDTERNFHQRRIDHLDTQIDATVYTLYNLTPAEIQIIEGSVK